MRKKFAVAFLMLLLSFGINLPIYAMPNEQHIAIQDFISEVQRVSRAPGIAVSVVIGEETHFFFTGVAHQRDDISINQGTLFELASISKQFTALGVLYLEERGLLSLEDSIADYLPWLTFRYNGQPVDMQNVRLYNFMHHTSGLPLVTKEGLSTLKSGVEALIDSELLFFPGEQFEYGNGNYNILGLVIETVTGQSYETFMEESIFRPLGMMQTFAYREAAVATGQFAQGYARQFIFFTVTRNAPESQKTENIPTGYLISSAQDMTRWKQVQLGLATDVPEIFHTIVSRSHKQGRSVAIPEGFPFPVGSHYAGGWILNAEKHSVEHGGNNPSFSTYVLLLLDEQAGITILANSCQVLDTNQIAHSIADILQGNLDVTYSMGGVQIQDVVFTLITVIGTLLALVFLAFALGRIKKGDKRPLTKKRIALIALWVIITVVIVVALFIFPRLMGSGATWSLVLSIVSFSILTWLVALILLCASITLFVAFPQCKNKY